MYNPGGSAVDVDAGEGSTEEKNGEDDVCIVFVGCDDDSDEDIVECVDLENESGEWEWVMAGVILSFFQILPFLKFSDANIFGLPKVSDVFTFGHNFCPKIKGSEKFGS